jgi:hypothetical protein
LEIFPQRNRVERAMLGRRMPLLDPETLTVLPHAALSDFFNPAMLEGALAEVERWYAREHDLLSHLRAKPKLEIPPVLRDEAAATSTHYLLSGSERRHTLSPAWRQLIEYGLHRRSSRYHAEFLVGLGLVLCPTLGKTLEWDGTLEDRSIAQAIATWLAQRHHGHSREWRESLRDARDSVAAATEAWRNRYLTRNSNTGQHLVDRILAAARALDPTLRYTLWLSPAERHRVDQIVEAAYPPGPQRRRFAIWVYSFLHHVKATLHGRAAGGRPVRIYERDGRDVVHLWISAKRMSKWPGGNGEDGKTGRTRYLEYREHLIRAGLLRVVIPYDRENGKATLYRIPVPDMHSCAGELPYPPSVLRRVVARINKERPRKRNGWGVSLAEAYHALHLVDRGADLAAELRERNARDVRRLVREIRTKIDARRGRGRGAGRLLGSTPTVRRGRRSDPDRYSSPAAATRRVARRSR